MIKTTEFLREYNKKLYYQNMIKNKLKKDKKEKKIVNEFNKIDNIYNFGIDKIYNLSILHNKIDWFRYYLELYIVEFLQKHNNIKSNKINLK